MQGRIADILEAVERCRRYVHLLDGEVDATVAQMAEDAIERNLQIIGEAANHLPAEITDAHPEIAWPQIRGLRNILVHQYFGVDIEVVRDVVETHLPSLAEVIRSSSRSMSAVSGSGLGENQLISMAWEGERRLLDPAVRSDPSAVGELLATDFHEIGQSGKHWTRHEILKVVAADLGDGSPTVLDEQHAQLIAPSKVLLTYRLEFEGRVSRRSSIWTVRAGQPLMVFHQGTASR